MSEHAAIGCDNDDMALTDRDLVSLYLRFPEMQQPDDDFHDGVYVESPLVPITTSSPESSPPSARLYSSPVPNLTRDETPTSSPLDPPPDSVPFPTLAVAVNEQEVDELIAGFDLILRSEGIPENAAGLFAEIKSVIVMMNSILFSATGEISTSLQNIWRVKSAARWLVSLLTDARDAVEREINAAESILELAAFTVRPALEDLWTNYKQMAELTIQ